LEATERARSDLHFIEPGKLNQNAFIESLIVVSETGA
jgi:hypothetical protein